MLYAIGITVMLGFLAVLLSWWLHLLFIGILICFILITLLAPFVDVPGMVKAEKLTYHSVFLLAELHSLKSLFSFCHVGLEESLICILIHNS